MPCGSWNNGLWPGIQFADVFTMQMQMSVSPKNTFLWGLHMECSQIWGIWNVARFVFGIVAAWASAFLIVKYPASVV